jgi:AraC-like DNA-binding protein
MRRSSSTMRVGGTALLPAHLAERGGAVPGLLHESGFVAAELSEPQGWLEMDRLGRLYEAAARELADPNFGLRFGLEIPLHAYGLLSYVVLNAPTVRVALENLLRFADHLAGAWDASLVHAGEQVRIRFAYPTERPDEYRHYVESNGAVLCVMMKALAGSTWTPSEVCFQHGSGEAGRDPGALLEAPVRFDRPANEIAFAASILDGAVIGADRTLLPTLEKQANELVCGTGVAAAAQPVGDRLVLDLQEEIVRGLCDGPPQLHRIARTFAMSTRTLQRELQRRGMRFKTLVNETRHRLALAYLDQPELSVTEVAFLVGYADLSAFDRAFRRVEGVSPSGWRSLQR